MPQSASCCVKARFRSSAVGCSGAVGDGWKLDAPLTVDCLPLTGRSGNSSLSPADQTSSDDSAPLSSPSSLNESVSLSTRLNDSESLNSSLLVLCVTALGDPLPLPVST